MHNLYFRQSKQLHVSAVLRQPSSCCMFYKCNKDTFFTFLKHSLYIYIYIYIYGFQNLFLRCPTPRLHFFLSSHWLSFRFLSFMAFLIPSIQFFFGLPRAVFCFGIHFNVILGNLPSAILWTWPYHLSWFCSISFIIVSSSPICCPIVTFLIFSFLDILEDLLRAEIPNARFIENKVFYAKHSRPYFGSVFITETCGDCLIHGIAHHIVLKMVERPQ